MTKTKWLPATTGKKNESFVHPKSLLDSEVKVLISIHEPRSFV